MTLPPFDRKVQLELAVSRHVRRMDRCNLLLRKSAKNPLKGSGKTASLRYRDSYSIGCFRELETARMVGETSGIPDPSCETMSFLSKLFVPNVSSSRPRFQPKRGLAGIPAQASQQRMDEES